MNTWRAMRVEYGSVEKDGSPDLDADWLADGWVALLRKWLADAERAGVRRAQRHGGRHGRRAGKAGHPHGVVQERGRNRHHVLHQLRLRQGRGARRDAVRVGDLPVVSARPPGARPWPRDEGRRRRRRPTTGRKRPRGSQLGAWASHQSQPDRLAGRRCWANSPTSPNGSPISTPCRCRRTGAATCIAPEVVEFWQGRENRVHNRIRVDTRRAHRAASALGVAGSSPTPRRCGRRTSAGCGWRASSPSSGRT